MSAVRGTFRTVDLDLGPCECPRRPDGSTYHDRDVATVKADRLDYGNIRKVAAAINTDPGPALGEGGLAQSVLNAQVTVSWNLLRLDAKDEPQPLAIEPASIDGLSPEQAMKLNEHSNRFGHYFGIKRGQAQDAEIPAAAPEPPNPSSGPSPDGSAAPSPSRTSRKRTRT